MEKHHLFRYASFTALTAAIAMSVMVIIMFLYPQANVLRFEKVNLVVVYTSYLLQAGLPLRIIMTVDHLFLILAASTFLLIASALKNERNVLIMYVISLPILITAYLDIYENHHIMSMFVSALQNIPITQEEINQQAVLSLVKFHGGNMIYFLLAFFLPTKTTYEKVFRYILLFALVPLSVIRYSFQDMMTESVVPYIPIAAGFFFASYIFYKWSKTA